MADLINRQAATTMSVMPKKYRKYQTMNLDDAYEQGWDDCQKCIDKLPSAESKKGKWIGKEQYANSPEYYSWQCSLCGCVLEDPTLDEPYPFCPNCGADMREGDA